MKNPQISATIPGDLLEQIEKLAMKENRSMSEMIAILLQRAVNERNRKKKVVKENNS